jgi:5'-nucleotidase
LRRVRAATGGAVVLLDGGDMFQGTLESNLNEGRSVVQAFAHLGYDAAAVGNHEFDFGPVGPDVTVQTPGDDPRGALLARAAEAPFPILSVNLVRADSGAVLPIGPRGGASTTIERAGVRIGIIGGSTEDTPRTTNSANVSDLRMLSLGPAIADEARRLRAAGVDLVFVAMHAGGSCRHFGSPDDHASCDPEDEVFAVTNAIPEGLVDGIVAGHTHSGVAHRFHGIPVIESFSNGQAFGRIDFAYDRRTRRVVDVNIHEPMRLCGLERRPSCEETRYEGAAISPDEVLSARIAWAFDEARARKEQSLGVRVEGPFARNYREESALGNLLADLMLEATPGADVALVNGGGIRADLREGTLRYGDLFEIFPFDNLFARVRVTGSELRRIVEHNLRADSGILSLGGVRVVARCSGEPGQIAITVTRTNGAPIADDEWLVLSTSDFIATGGDGLFRSIAMDGRTQIERERPVIRDVLAERLRARPAIRAEEFFDASARRLSFEGARPMACSQ